MEKSLVIIPTYNEKENIKNIINAVLKQSFHPDVLIVDDNSPDGTSSIVKEMMGNNKRIKMILREKKLGLGTAYIDGFKWGLKDNYEYFFEMDADFSHNPDDLERIYNELKYYDVVIGSRYIKGISVQNWPLSRILLSYFANLYTRFLTGLKIKDITAGFVGYKREILEKIPLERIKSDGYGFQIEIKYNASMKKAKIKEIPIVFIDRRSGYSKMSKGIIVKAFFLVLKIGMKRFYNR
uniref:Polyprenol monophosphomannose synthase n=1 Tax=candidate division WOR-3 bacterium TaxID=2052148 RepID=A0A7C4YA97_UNCW3